MQENDDSVLDLIKPINVSKKQWLSFGLVFLILWGISFYLWFQVELDKFILFSLNNSHFDNRTTFLFQFFSRYGMALIVFIYLFYLIMSFKINNLKNGKQIFLLILFSFAIAGITGDILKEVFNRSRPIVKYANDIICLSNPNTASFPSGHASKSVALVLPFLFFVYYKGLFHSFIKVILVFIALMVCVARILLGAHYLSDVLSGIGLVFLCLPVSVLISNQITKKMTCKKLEFAARIWILVYIGLIIFLIII